MIIEDLEQLAAFMGATDATLNSMGLRLYKDTTCGAWLIFDFEEVPGVHASSESRVYGILIGSIVEGVCAEAGPVSLRFPFTSDEYYAAISRVEMEADEIWKNTHGCPYCWGNGGNEETWNPGVTAVDPGCPECDGHGVTI